MKTRSTKPLSRRQLEVAALTWRRALLRKLPVAAAISAAISGVPLASAQDSAAGGLEEVIVTAQKRSENLQTVPLSIQSINTEKLEQLQIASLDDYIKFLPSVSYVRSRGQGGSGQPGSAQVYMRGVVSGGDGNHSGSQPSVGTYLDEQPVTTASGTLDVHVYDIARVEALAGPQGTLYGASSQAGTIRIISNKPDPTGFKAAYNISGNTVNHGGVGYEAEGFVNIPISPIAAIRLVGWDRHDAGYIDNVAGTGAPGTGIVNGVRIYPTWNAANGGRGTIGAGAISNAAFVKQKYNISDTRGGRAALKIDLNDSWTVTPSFMGQKATANGFFAYDPAIGDLKVTHFSPETSEDRFTQSALTIEGKISNLDVVFAGAYMSRNRQAVADYSDYSFFYDKLFGSGSSSQDDLGKIIDPTQQVLSKGGFTKWSSELRASTSQEARLRATFGVFVQRQVQDIEERYYIPLGTGRGLAPNRSIPGWPSTIWLTEQQRVDGDSALFGQVTYDLTPKLALTGGLRFYKNNNSLRGYYGFAPTISSRTGIARCGPADFALPRNPQFEPFHGAPCTNLNKTTNENGHTPRVNLTYKFDQDHMVYATYSEGFRPGGANRQSLAGVGPYKADFLKNYELGWKTQWADHRVRFNGAVFLEDWKDFQFSFLTNPGSLTVIDNAGQARIKGLEANIEWSATSALTLIGSFALLDPKLTQDYCGTQGVTSCPNLVTTFSDGGAPLRGPLAPAGTTLPVTPKFKANLVARYGFGLRDWEGNAQAALVYQGASSPALRTADRVRLGEQAAYSLIDLSAGLARNGMAFDLFVSNALDKRAELTRFALCGVTKCGQTYIVPAQPRSIGLKFSQKF